MENLYKGAERRKFLRLEYITPIALKVCKEETISKILQGYTANISESGILCNIKEKVSKGDILWIAFDRGTLDLCTEIERRCLIYQNGIIGKVTRIEQKSDLSFNVGIQFITREEDNLSYIYPKIHFLKDTKEEEEKEEENEAA